MRKHIIALLVVVMVLCCCLTLAACNKTNVLDSYIFEMDGTTVSEDFTLPATIGGENASWKSDNTAIQTEKRDSDWLAKVTLPESGDVNVTLTVTVGKNSKNYTVRVKSLDVYDFMNNYVFPKNKATIVDNFDLETSCTYKGKTATIAWSVDPEYELYIKVIENGTKLEVTPQSAQTQVQIKGTFTYAGVSASQSYRMTVYKTLEGLELVNYWYTNTGVSIDMSGYVVAIATPYSEQYGNITFYMVNDDFTAGYYVYRVKATAAVAPKIVPGAHVTVTGTTNTNYNGLIETNAGGTVTVDEDKTAINVNEKVYAIDEEILGNLPSTFYHESRLVSLSNWKVKSVCAEADKKVGDNFTLMTLTKGGVDVEIRISKYMEGAYATKKGDTTFDALWKLTDTYPVGTLVNVKGILSNYKNVWQIIPMAATDMAKSDKAADPDDKRDYAGMKVAAAIEAVKAELIKAKLNDKNGKTVRVQSNSEFTLPATVEGVSVVYTVEGKSNAVTIKDNKLTVKPGNPETTTIRATYKVGEFEAVQFFFVESLIPTAASMLDDFTAALPEKIREVTDLPTTPAGATVEWKVVSGDTSIAIKGGQLIPTLKEKDVATIINATLTYNNVTRSKDYVVIVRAGKGSVEVNAPFEDGKGYILTVDQTNLAKQIFAANKMDGYYIKAIDNIDNAQFVYVEKVADGYKLYFQTTNKDKTVTKTYIAYGTDGEHTNILLDSKGEESNVWKWNAENKCFVCTLTTNKGTSDYYIGANYTNQTFRLNAVKENKPFFNENNFRAYLGEAKFVPLTEYGVTVAKDSSEHATVTLKETKGINGQKFTFTVNVEEGYELVSVKVNGEKVEEVNGVYTGIVKGATTVSVATQQQGAEVTFIKLALNAADALADGATTADSYILIGKVSEITSAYNANFKNVSFKISDGKFEVLIYRYNLDDASTIKVGDSIAIAAPMKKYGTTLEAVAKFVKLNVTDLATACAAGLDGTGAAGTMVYGRITEIGTEYNAGYNNISFTISDGTTDLYCFRVKGGADLQVGDYVLIIGKPVMHNSNAQIDKGATYIKNGIYVAE